MNLCETCKYFVPRVVFDDGAKNICFSKGGVIWGMKEFKNNRITKSSNDVFAWITIDPINNMPEWCIYKFERNLIE